MRMSLLLLCDRLRLPIGLQGRSARIILLFSLSLCGSTLPAQEPDDNGIDKHTVQLLMQRIDQLKRGSGNWRLTNSKQECRGTATAPGFPVARR